MVIREAVAADASSIAAIYNYYVTDTTITFEEQTISTREMQVRMDNVRAANLPWIVAELDSEIIGYAYASQWKQRSAYRFCVEASVYVSQTAHQKGVGTQLYQALFTQLKCLPVNAVLGVITLPNPASIALHEKMGMTKAGHFQQVGYKFGQWLDVGYWQINLGQKPNT